MIEFELRIGFGRKGLLIELGYFIIIRVIYLFLD